MWDAAKIINTSSVWAMIHSRPISMSRVGITSLRWWTRLLPIFLDGMTDQSASRRARGRANERTTRSTRCQTTDNCAGPSTGRCSLASRGIT